jgi:fucose permease
MSRAQAHDTSTPPPGPGMTTTRVHAAKRAVAVVFAMSGFAFASWASRLPAVRDTLEITPSGLAVLLLALSCGSLPALIMSGALVQRLGPRRACLIGMVVMTVFLTFAATTPPVPVMAVSLALVGAGMSTWDVSMNVEGAGVERLLGHEVMPRFHAAYSLGTVTGAAGGVAAAASGLPVAWHLGAANALTACAVLAALPHFAGPRAWGARTQEPTPDSSSRKGGGTGAMRAWREPRTLLIGLVVMGTAFAEGTANDWLTVALVDGYGVDHAVGALGFGLLVAAMTGTRLAGPSILAALGRVTAIRTGAVLVAVGILAVQAGPSLAAAAGPAVALVPAVAGVLLWGTGASLGFPVGMSAASDDPRYAAARVSVVSSIGYLAFIAGPPLLGLLGDRVGVLRAMLAVEVAVVLSLLAAGAARRPAEEVPQETAAAHGARG